MEILESVDRIYPPKKDIFEMFHLLRPKDITVVIVGQNPYQNEHACGIPFVSARGSMTKSLENITKELKQEYPYLNISHDTNQIIKSWIEQGVFLLNMSMTIGPDEKYTSDHSIMWEEFVRELIAYITKDKKVPIILMGSVAWSLDGKLSIKVPHPISRDDKFVGCDVFIRCNQILDEPILWV